MYIKKTKKELVFCIENKVFDDNVLKNILDLTDSKKRVGIDMKKVEVIKSKELINYLIGNQFSLFNLNSELMAYLSIVLKGSLKTYVNCFDFLNNKRELTIRHFLIA